MYALNNRQESENSPDVVTVMIRVFEFTIYALLDPGARIFFFVTPYVAMNFEIIPDQLSKLFNVSTHVGEFILAQRFYHDCSIFVSHKSSMTNLIELHPCLLCTIRLKILSYQVSDSK